MESISAAWDLEVDPSIVDRLCDIILVDEILWYISQFYADIFWTLHWGLQVKVFCVVEIKAITRAR